MKNIKIKYTQLLFLYAYLRLIDLSLDRSRWTSWNELQDYFKTSITPPSLVIQYLSKSFDLSNIDLGKSVFSIKEKSIMNRFKPILFKSLSLKQDEILYGYKILNDFAEVLNSDNKNYNAEIDKLRIDIATYYSDFLGKMILWKDLDELMKVEHYLQNDHTETSKLKKFVPDDFYNS